MNSRKWMVFILVVLLSAGSVSGCSNVKLAKTEDGSKSLSQERTEDNVGALSGDGEKFGDAKTGLVLKSGLDESKQSAGALKGKVICIDPGHQVKGNNSKEPIAPGSNILKAKTTSGTAGVVTKIPEYKLNLEVALLVKEELKKHGATVVMTRESNNVDISNVERAKIANRSKADLAVRIHADGSENRKVRGASVLYPGSKYVKDEGLLKNSKTAAEKVAKEIGKKPGTVSVKTVQRDDLTGFNWSTVPVILVEMGFMSNPEEDKLMKTEEFRKGMAGAIAKGIVNCLKHQDA